MVVPTTRWLAEPPHDPIRRRLRQTTRRRGQLVHRRAVAKMPPRRMPRPIAARTLFLGREALILGAMSARACLAARTFWTTSPRVALLDGICGRGDDHRGRAERAPRVTPSPPMTRCPISSQTKRHVRHTRPWVGREQTNSPRDGPSRAAPRTYASRGTTSSPAIARALGSSSTRRPLGHSPTSLNSPTSCIGTMDRSLTGSRAGRRRAVGRSQRQVVVKTNPRRVMRWTRPGHDTKDAPMPAERSSWDAAWFTDRRERLARGMGTR